MFRRQLRHLVVYLHLVFVQDGGKSLQRNPTQYGFHHRPERQLAAIGLKELAGQCRMVFDCVRALQRRNAWPDCSLREIQQEFERQHQRRIDVGTVSGRVRQLLDMHWLQRRTDPRACRVTGKAVHPVYALPKQMEAFAA